MTKKILISITLGLGLLAVFALFQTSRLANMDSTESISERKQIIVVQPMTAPAINSNDNSNSNSTHTEKSISSDTSISASTINQETALMQAREALELQQQRLTVLRNQQAKQIEQINISYPNQINANSSEIINLAESLQVQRLAENDIRDATTIAMQEQANAARLNREQIDLNILQVQQNMQQLRELLMTAPPPGVVTVTEQQTRINNLQNLYLEQNQQLDLLREQRANIPAMVQQQTNAINLLSQQQRADLIESQTQTQDQIFSLRDEMTRLENASRQVRMSMIPLSQQINQVESDYQNQLQKVRTLEGQLIQE